MADFDVAATGLAVPTSPAFKVAMRPAIAVRNNGLYNANVTGLVRIYKAGLMVFNSAVAATAVPPGATRNATAAEDWTPSVIGDYVVNGYVTTPSDQVEPNNNLPSVTITVIEGEPPPPPTVEPHAAQHEAGGTDQVSVEGLQGELATPQEPKDHAAAHEAGGTDELSVAGLHGTLADNQPVSPHDNLSHTVEFASTSELAAHETDPAPHAMTSNLEYLVHKDVANGYAGLDSSALLPVTRILGATAERLLPLNDSTQGTALSIVRSNHLHRTPGGFIGSTGFVPGSAPSTMIDATVPAGFFSQSQKYYQLRVVSGVLMQCSPGAVLTVTLFYKAGAEPTVQLAQMQHTFSPGVGAGSAGLLKMIAGFIGATPTVGGWAVCEFTLSPTGGSTVHKHVVSLVPGFNPTPAGKILLQAQFVVGLPGDTCSLKPIGLEITHDAAPQTVS